MLSIPGNAWIATPGGKISQYPQLEQIGNTEKEVHIEYLSRTDKRCDFTIVFDEPLEANDEPFDYAFSVIYSRHTLMHRDNVEEAYKNDAFKKDYCSYESVTPIDELVLEVTFPAGLGFVPAALVFYGGEGWVHKQELTRVADDFSKIPNGAVFKIEKPIIGFTYLIWWETPE